MLFLSLHMEARQIETRTGSITYFHVRNIMQTWFYKYNFDIGYNNCEKNICILHQINVLQYLVDHSRVVLSKCDHEGSDYINASFISVSLYLYIRTYICNIVRIYNQIMHITYICIIII